MPIYPPSYHSHMPKFIKCLDPGVGLCKACLKYVFPANAISHINNKGSCCHLTIEMSDFCGFWFSFYISTLDFTVKLYTPFHCTAVHHTSLYSCTYHFAVWLYTTLHYTTVQYTLLYSCTPNFTVHLYTILHSTSQPLTSLFRCTTHFTI